MKKQVLFLILVSLIGVGLSIWYFGFHTKSEQLKRSSSTIKAGTAGLLPPSVFKPKQGEQISYRFNVISDISVSSDLFLNQDPGGVSKPNTHFTTLSMAFSGDLYLKFFHDSNTKFLNVAGLIQSHALKINDREPVYADAIPYPFTFRMTPKGYLSDYVYTKNVPVDAQSVIKTLLSAMQTILPKDRSTVWQTREVDTTGQYEAGYTVTENVAAKRVLLLSKEKKNYLKVFASELGVNDALDSASVKITKSRIDTLLAPNEAWIVKTDQHEETIMTDKEKETGRVKTDMSATLQKKKSPVRFSEHFADVLKTMLPADWLRKKYSQTDPAFNALSENLNLDNALKLFLQMSDGQSGAQRRQAEAFFVNYLRQYPEASYDLIKALDADPGKNRFNHDNHLLLWHLITKAGHADAQRAVVEAVINPDYSELTHMRAIAYVHSFEYPESFMADTLWDFYHGIDMATADEKDKELGVMALYAIGGLGSEDKLNDTIKPDIGKTLSENLQNADTTYLQVVNLQAIGNYGQPTVLPQIEPYFSSDNETVRMASYSALRRMPPEKAFATFTTQYSRESSADVKSAALKTLTEMTATDDIVAWAGEEILAVKRSEDQEFLTKVLGENLESNPQSESALRGLLAKKPSNRVKKTVYRYIKP